MPSWVQEAWAVAQMSQLDCVPKCSSHLEGISQWKQDLTGEKPESMISCIKEGIPFNGSRKLGCPRVHLVDSVRVY